MNVAGEAPGELSVVVHGSPRPAPSSRAATTVMREQHAEPSR